MVNFEPSLLFEREHFLSLDFYIGQYHFDDFHLSFHVSFRKSFHFGFQKNLFYFRIRFHETDRGQYHTPHSLVGHPFLGMGRHV